MFRDPRREDHTIWTAVAPDAVFTVRTYATRRDYEPRRARPLVRKFRARSRQTSRSQRYDRADPAPVIKVRSPLPLYGVDATRSVRRWFRALAPTCFGPAGEGPLVAVSDHCEPSMTARSGTDLGQPREGLGAALSAVTFWPRPDAPACCVKNELCVDADPGFAVADLGPVADELQWPAWWQRPGPPPEC